MKNISYISCPSCGFIMKPVWYLEKELDTHGIPTGRTHKACSCLLCDSCGHKETVDGSFDELDEKYEGLIHLGPYTSNAEGSTFVELEQDFHRIVDAMKGKKSTTHD